MSKRIAFLVQNNHVLFNTIPVSQYAWKKNIPLIDRSSYEGFDPNDCGVDWGEYDVVVPWGSVQFLRCLRGTTLVSKWLYRESAFHTDEWMKHFGQRALNFGGQCTPAAEVPALLETMQTAHIRPNSVDKAFIATVFTPETWANAVEERNIDPTLGCFVSQPKQIVAEYRCWIINGTIIEMSQYLRDGAFNQVAVDPTSKLWDQAQDLANTYLPVPVIVMDVAETADDVLFLEFNALPSSGWYAGSKENIMDALVDWIQTST